MAERAAWDFLKSRVYEGQFCPEIVTICPSFILGEVIGSGDVTSAAIVKKMILGEIPGWPDMNFNCVDVKDVSLAHLRALERPGCSNKRFCLSREENCKFIDLARWLEQTLDDAGYNYSIRTMSLSRWMVKLGAFFSSDLSNVLFLTDEPERTYINTRSRELLGIEYRRTPQELVFAAADSMIKSGAVPLKVKKAKK